MKSITKLHGIISATLIFSVAGVDTFAQNVGVGTSTPAEKLHVVGSVRSSTLAGAGNREVLADPNGTLIIGTGANAPDWTILGNANTTFGTNYLGTTNAQGLDFRTNAVIRQSILSTGAVYLNDAVPLNNALFSSYAGAPTATNVGVDGQGASMGVLGIGGTGVWGQTSLAGSDGVYGLNTNPSGFGMTGEGQQGILGLNTAGTYWTSGVAGIGGVGLSGWGVGVGSTGAIVKSDNAAGGTGIIAIGNNIAAVGGLVGGSGVAAKGTAVGVWGQATGGGSPTGGMFGANGVVGYSLTGSGSGVSGAGTICGVFGYATNTGGSRYGAYFDTGGAAGYAYVGGWLAGWGNIKINGNGTVNTIVKDGAGNDVMLTCPEAPEVLFQDYGQGELVSGIVHIDIDPIFAKNVTINNKHPLRVFIQLEGDCNGVYVTNKTANGFDVVELNGGASNVSFTYTIVGNRANETMPNGDVTNYTDARWAAAPPRLEKTQLNPGSSEHESKSVKEGKRQKAKTFERE